MNHDEIEQEDPWIREIKNNQFSNFSLLKPVIVDFSKNC